MLWTSSKNRNFQRSFSQTPTFCKGLKTSLTSEKDYKEVKQVQVFLLILLFLTCKAPKEFVDNVYSLSSPMRLRVSDLLTVPKVKVKIQSSLSSNLWTFYEKALQYD